MKKSIKETVYLSENAKGLFTNIDFADTFSTTNHKQSIDEVTRLIFGTFPAWVSYLFRLRNFIVGFFGLKTEIPEDYKEEAYVSFFKAYQQSEKELIVGADDKHLNFRAIITNTGAAVYNIKVTTLVEYNNTFGKVYMTVIKPFHVLVVKRMVGQAYSV
ncbi:DUF2867 domain-containing protein [Wenyingzhuangia sp. IMCC45574]